MLQDDSSPSSPSAVRDDLLPIQSTQVGAPEAPYDERLGFVFFSKLPSELQIYIWEFVCELEGPRVVAVYSQRVIPTVQPFRGFKHFWAGFTSPTPIPSALHVCSLSRKLGLIKYELCFGMTSPEVIVAPMIYFNHEKDILCFREDRKLHPWAHRSCYEPFISLANRTDLEKVQNLAFQSHIPGALHLSFDAFHKDMKRWNSLKSVSLGYDAPGMIVGKRVNFEKIKGNDLDFANSCKNPFYGDSLLGGRTRLDEPTHENVREVLDKAKHCIEKGYTPMDEEPASAEVRWEVHFGSFQNT